MFWQSFRENGFSFFFFIRTMVYELRFIIRERKHDTINVPYACTPKNATNRRHLFTSRYFHRVLPTGLGRGGQSNLDDIRAQSHLAVPCLVRRRITRANDSLRERFASTENVSRFSRLDNYSGNEYRRDDPGNRFGGILKKNRSYLARLEASRVALLVFARQRRLP